jgi:hypothetical protein
MESVAALRETSYSDKPLVQNFPRSTLPLSGSHPDVTNGASSYVCNQVRLRPTKTFWIVAAIVLLACIGLGVICFCT